MRVIIQTVVSRLCGDQGCQGLYTGCRLEELGQLTLSDIKTEGEIGYLDINTLDDGKPLKTKGSRRKIPLHPELIRLGLNAHLERLRRKGGTRLYPELERAPRGEPMAARSKWWGRYRAPAP